MIRKIYLDMDGVLSHFDEAFSKLRNGETHILPDVEFWALVANAPEFWETLPLFPGAKELYAYARSLNVPVEILTAPSRTDTRCYLGKILWLKKHGFDVDNINFARAHNKRLYAKPHYVLIDDKPENIVGWVLDGGYGILHKDLESTIKELESFNEV